MWIGCIPQRRLNQMGVCPSEDLSAAIAACTALIASACMFSPIAASIDASSGR